MKLFRKLIGNFTSKPIYIFLTGIIATIAANAVMISKSGESLPNDWKYFNALSLVVRSAVWNYKTFPLHNPWVCGGLDLLTNPQNRIFSPFMLADLLMAPQVANIFSILVYGALGFYGMTILICEMGASLSAGILGAILFLNGTWFGLHYYSGHIPFGAFQALPFALAALYRIDRPQVVVCSALFAALGILDGAFYAMTSAAMLVLTWLACSKHHRENLIHSVKRHPICWIASLFASLLLAAPKIIPTLTGLAAISIRSEFTSLSFSDTISALFNPLLTIWDPFPAQDGAIDFHEFGCYLTISACITLAAGLLIDKNFRSRVLPLAAGMAFWLWIGSGWFPDFNPWNLFQRIPILNKLHIQSRTFILMYFLFTIAVALGWNAVRKHKILATALFSFVVIESLLARNFTAAAPLIKREPVPGWNDWITSQTISTHFPFASSPSHYLLRKDSGTSLCYEPSFTVTAISDNEELDYRGPVYIDPPGTGRVKLDQFTPGEISFDYQTIEHGSRIVFNANALYGWQIRGARGKLTGKGSELLIFTPEQPGEGRATLTYWPPYVPWILGSFIAGIALFSGVFLFISRNPGSNRVKRKKI